MIETDIIEQPAMAEQPDQTNAVAVNLTWETPHDCEECGHGED